jgi:predicted transcriptional regulator
MTEPSDELVDVRSKLDAETNRVVDAVAHATGKDKSAVIREAMQAWAQEEVHRATVVLRLARSKGNETA